MSDIKYAYLKGQTWLYRRNYPKDVAPVIGARALKQSLKTGDVKLARARAAQVNAKYEELVRKVRTGAEDVLSDAETHVDGASNTPVGRFLVSRPRYPPDERGFPDRRNRLAVGCRKGDSRALRPRQLHHRLSPIPVRLRASHHTGGDGGGPDHRLIPLFPLLIPNPPRAFPY
ncbi:DUF6538 domain-containing protein [Roseovarius pacificus]|uniref:DUF6538 domain-containing protein n=1 Tax=Roseovarius pacificus TaxID=337701 RepID=UPI0040399952